jgi:hypothetical protein
MAAQGAAPSAARHTRCGLGRGQRLLRASGMPLPRRCHAGARAPALPSALARRAPPRRCGTPLSGAAAGRQRGGRGGGSQGHESQRSQARCARHCAIAGTRQSAPPGLPGPHSPMPHQIAHELWGARSYTFSTTGAMAAGAPPGPGARGRRRCCWPAGGEAQPDQSFADAR